MPHSRWLRPTAQRPALLALRLKASSHAGQKFTTVLFQNSAIMVEKTPHSVLKNRLRMVIIHSHKY